MARTPVHHPHPHTPDPAPRLLSLLPVACAVFDAPTGRLLQANPGYFALFGETGSRQALAQWLGRQELESAEGSLQVRAGERSLVLDWRTGEDAGQACWVLTAADVSPQVARLREETQQAERLLFTSRMMSVGEMAATLAHELNQPLAAIVNYLNGSLRLLERAGPAPVLTAVAAAREQALHAGEVIGRVREFVKAREPRRGPLSVPALAETVVRLLAQEADRYRVRVHSTFPPDLPPVWADRVMLEQVLLNLLKNAMEALADAPLRQIELQARINLDGEVEVRVLDTGPGLSEERQASLFNAFQSTKAEGLGIGLAICRSILEYHNGRLFHEPRDGGGSVFGFTLPPAPAEAEGA